MFKRIAVGLAGAATPAAKVARFAERSSLVSSDLAEIISKPFDRKAAVDRSAMSQRLFESIKEQLTWEDYEGMPKGLQYLVDHLAQRLFDKFTWRWGGITQEMINVIAAEKRSPRQSARRVKRSVDSLRRMAAEVAHQEQGLQDKHVPAHLKQLIGKKTISLFKKLCEETQYADKFLWRDIAEGFSIIGEMSPTGVWEPLEFPERVTEEAIREYADGLKTFKAKKPSWMPCASF